MRFTSNKTSHTGPLLGTHLQMPYNAPPVSTPQLRHSTSSQAIIRHSSLSTNLFNIIQPASLSDHLQSMAKTVRFSLANAPVCDADPYMKWHLRCGHRCNIEDLSHKCDGVPSLRKPANLQLCDACVGAKSTKRHRNKSRRPYSEPVSEGEYWAMDVRYATTPSIIHNHMYVLVVVDVFSKWTELLFAPLRSDLEDKLILLAMRTKTPSGLISLKRVKWDRGGEFENDKVRDFFITNGCSISTVGTKAS